MADPTTSESVTDCPRPPTERDAWLDNIKVLAIVLVVVGHAVGLMRRQTEVAPAVSNFIYFFHIPLFALVSGWTARRTTAGPAGLSRIFLTLLVPYLIFECTAAAIAAHAGDYAYRPSLELPSFGLWYLLSLATWRLWWPWVAGARPRFVLAASIAATVESATCRESTTYCRSLDRSSSSRHSSSVRASGQS